jgi:hypothetical protein
MLHPYRSGPEAVSIVAVFRGVGKFSMSEPGYKPTSAYDKRDLHTRKRQSDAGRKRCGKAQRSP